MPPKRKILFSYELQVRGGGRDKPILIGEPILTVDHFSISILVHEYSFNSYMFL